MEEQPSAAPEPRVHYIDALKALIVYGILLYHVCLPFSTTSWLVHDRGESAILTLFAAFCFPWGIPLMFLIAGSASWFGLRSRGGRRFVQERFLRLVLPMLAGIAVLSPLQWFAIQGRPWTFAGLLAAYPAFLRQVRLAWDPVILGRVGYHLWFLGDLFAISLVALPLMLWLRSPAGRDTTRRVVDLTRARGGVYLLCVPLVAWQMLLRAKFSGYQDWADVATYTFVFLAGYLLIADRRYEAAVRRDIDLFLAVGLVSVIAVGLLGILPGLAPETAGASALRQEVYAVFWSLNIWSWLLAVLYLGIRWLDVPRRIVEYASESALPFYVLHHPVVVILAASVVRLDMGVWPKFAMLLVGSLATTLALYEFGVRRWNVTRFLFGLKALPAEDGERELTVVGRVAA